MYKRQLCDYIEFIDDADLYQFGFSRGLSTGMCSYAFKNTVNLYRQNGSHVFCCFIDFNKAFHSVDYWLLFCKLLDCNDTNECYLTTRLLAYWYSHQQIFVCWQNIQSECFGIANGVRQGSLLSPFLFRFYIRNLLKAVVSSGIGCCVAGTFINILAYADDIVLMASSWRDLQQLLGILEEASTAI